MHALFIACEQFENAPTPSTDKHIRAPSSWHGYLDEAVLYGCGRCSARCNSINHELCDDAPCLAAQIMTKSPSSKYIHCSFLLCKKHCSLDDQAVAAGQSFYRFTTGNAPCLGGSRVDANNSAARAIAASIEQNRILQDMFQPGALVIVCYATGATRTQPLHEGTFSILRQTRWSTHELLDFDGSINHRNITPSMMEVITLHPS